MIEPTSLWRHLKKEGETKEVKEGKGRKRREQGEPLSGTGRVRYVRYQVHALPCVKGVIWMARLGYRQ
jgi:hypothetical protein